MVCTVTPADAPAADTAQALSPREERRRVRLETTRSQVLDAAEKTFAANGFHGTTIKSIAEQCQIAVGTMYSLFDDKDSVYEAVLRRRGNALKALTDAKIAEPGPDDTKLVELAELQISYFRAHPEWSHIASEIGSGPSALAATRQVPQMYEVGHHVVAEAIADVIARGQRNGTIRAGQPLALALIFLGMLRSFYGIDSGGNTGYALEEFLDLIRASFSASDRTTPKKRTT